MILVTGFEPFGGDLHNPSAVVAKALESMDVAVRILPVDGTKIQAALKFAILETKPQMLLMLGLARGKTRLTLEKVAINWLEYRIPDNAGLVQHGKPILENAPDALFSSLPLETVQEALKINRVPMELSFSAGAFLCNQVFFLARALYPDIPSGFLHLPSDETLALSKSEPFLPLKYQIKAVKLVLETLQPLLS
jgi:pyroglutamyl-peptidase